MIKLPRPIGPHADPVRIHTNMDLLVKQLVTRMPSIHVRTGPIISDPAASIPTTTLYAPTTVTQESGHYRVTATLITTRVGTAGSVSVTIGWNNGVTGITSTSPTIIFTALGNEVDFTIPIFAAAGTSITYATTVAGITGNPAYSLNIKMEFLS